MNLLSILADHLNKRETAPLSSDENLEELVMHAHAQQVEAIIFKQCKIGALSNNYASSVFYYTNRLKLIEQISKSFIENGIEFVIVKGTEVAKYYPIPALRTMGDTDIIVRSRDKVKADELLKAMGFTCDYNYWKSGLEFELHDCLVYEGDGETSAVTSYFNDVWNHVVGDKLEWNFHFLFLLLHLKKHLIHSGVGFRQFYDLAVLMKYNQELDWDVIVCEAKKLGLTGFLKICIAMCCTWFDMEPPIQVDTLDETFIQAATAKIYDNGVFGDAKNDLTEAARIEKSSLPKPLVKLISTIRFLFPSYGAMKGISYYSFLIDRPYLLPVAWIYRIIRAVKEKKTLDGRIERVNVDGEQVKNYVDMLEKWGL